MKRFLSICVAALCCLTAFADDAESFAQKTKGKRLEIHYIFTINSGKKELKGNGVLQYQDGAFRYEDDGMRVYNDRESFWTVDLVSREITIEPGITLDVMTDPSLILRYLGINPKGASVKPYIGADGSPKGFDVTLKDKTEMKVKIDRIAVLPEGPLSDFSLNLSKPDKSLKIDPSWVVTDLR